MPAYNSDIGKYTQKKNPADYNYNKPFGERWSEEDMAGYQLSQGIIKKTPQYDPNWIAQSRKESDELYQRKVFDRDYQTNQGVFANKPDINLSEDERTQLFQSMMQEQQQKKQAVSQYAAANAPMRPAISSADRAQWDREHPLGGSPIEAELKRAGSVEDVRAIAETVEGAKLFGSPEDLQVGEVALRQLNPKAFDLFRADEVSRKTEEGSLASYYKKYVDPASTLSPLLMAEKVKSNPVWKQSHDDLMGLFQASASRGIESMTQLAADEAAVSSLKTRDAKYLYGISTAKEAKDFVSRTVASGKFSTPAKAKAAAEQAIKENNPDVHKTYLAGELTDIDVPITKLSASQQALRINIKKGAGPDAKTVKTTVGKLEREYQRELAYATNLQDSKGIIAAQEKLNGLDDYAAEQGKLKRALVETGSFDEVKGAGLRDTIASKVGAENSGFAYSDMITVSTSDEKSVAMANSLASRMVSSKNVEITETKSGSPKMTATNTTFAELGKSVANETLNALAGKKDVTQEQVDEIVFDNIVKALSAPGVKITATGENAQAELIKEIQYAVKSELDLREKKVAEEFNKKREEEVLPLVDKVVGYAASISKWTGAEASKIYSVTEQRIATDKNFNIDLDLETFDLDKSGKIDNPKEIAYAYLVKQNPKFKSVLARIARGGPTPEMSQLDDAFSIISSKFAEGRDLYYQGRLEAQNEKWEKAGMGSAARFLIAAGSATKDSSNEEKQAKYEADGTVSVDFNNPEGNKAGEFWYADMRFGQFAKTLDKSQQVAFNQLIGGANEFGVYGTTADKNTRDMALAVAGGQWGKVVEEQLVGMGLVSELNTAQELNSKLASERAAMADQRGSAAKVDWNEEIEYPPSLKSIFESDATANGLYISGMKEFISSDDPRKLHMAIAYASLLSRQNNTNAIIKGTSMAVGKLREASFGDLDKDLVKGRESKLSLLMKKMNRPGAVLQSSDLDVATSETSRLVLQGKLSDDELVSLKSTLLGIKSDIEEARGDTQEQIVRFGGVMLPDVAEGLERFANKGLASIDQQMKKGDLTPSVFDVVTTKRVDQATDIALDTYQPLRAILKRIGLQVDDPVSRIVRRKIKETGILQGVIGAVAAGNVAIPLTAAKLVSRDASIIWNEVKKIYPAIEAEWELMAKEEKAKAGGQ